ncbi:MAG: ribose-phosphate diphosphokinase [Chitinophagaceae bacterium]
MQDQHEVKIFSGNASHGLSLNIAEKYGMPLGNIEIQQFKDGEIQVKYGSSVRGAHVFLVQSTCSPCSNIMELLLMIDAARRASAYKVIAVIPYYGYARQDRKDQPRVAIGSKLIANMLTAAGADRIITMDLHAPQIQGYFDIPLDHLESYVVFIPYIRNLNLQNLVFAAPDVGSAKRIRTMSTIFEVDMALCDKYRKRVNEVASMTVIGDVEGKDIVLIDDICDTAGTLTRSANLIKENGAKSVRAFCTHAILSGDAIKNIENSCLEELVVTDTILISQEKLNACSKIKVLSVADIFSKAIKHAVFNESINDLFFRK